MKAILVLSAEFFAMDFQLLDVAQQALFLGATLRLHTLELENSPPKSRQRLVQVMIVVGCSHW